MTGPPARARARSVSAEMHAGFSAMRSAMPMNIKLKCRGATPLQEVGADIDRIVSIRTEAREQFAPLAATPGPWLFGGFSVADAMRDRPAMREWERDALAEGVSLPYDDAVARWGGSR